MPFGQINRNNYQQGNAVAKKNKNIISLCVMNKNDDIIFLLNIVISPWGKLDNPGDEPLEWLDVWQNSLVIL